MRIVSGPNTLRLEIAEVIPQALPSAGDACVNAEVSTADFSGRASCWVEASALEAFLSALRALDHKRSGEARVESICPGELRLRIYSVDSLGHFALSGRIAERSSAVEFQFELDPSSLAEISRSLESGWRGLPPNTSFERTREG